ncbi:hypothetical protein DNTS_001285 [Danionella cerebrum]|uniref:IRG-type G domain-containing protein n=1 Tax=Danionella cerebrum TaxID=2873325 RepID=A0A553Q3L4_9TELE|nr:hypothetical protein DNTS_001285 [Danionella translucida]
MFNMRFCVRNEKGKIKNKKTQKRRQTALTSEPLQTWLCVCLRRGLADRAKIQDDHFNKIEKVFSSENLEEIPGLLTSLLEVFGRFKIDVAITGESGAGKSSLINVFLEMKPDDAGAAATGSVETTMEPTVYQNPNLPHIRLWDLPGMGTPSFGSKSYVRAVNFNLYDMFMIVISEREKKVDTKVFLVSTHSHTHSYELQKLIRTFKEEAFLLRAKEFSAFLDALFYKGWFKPKSFEHIQQTQKLAAEDIKALQCMYEKTGFGAVKVSAVLEALSHFQLDLAILGETGSGTSTLVYSLLGLEIEDCGGASVSVSSPLLSDRYPDVRFWDISGVEVFMENLMYDSKQALDCFDFFIIIVSDWEEARHMKLARAVEGLRKHYLLVQTKADHYLQRQRALCCEESEILDGLRAQNTQELARERLSQQQIFLINSRDRSALDFVALESTLSGDLNTIRESAFAHHIKRALKERNMVLAENRFSV